MDFGYEVSQALKACEERSLWWMLPQGIEAQTLANLYQALEQDLEIIPVINKIDLPAARPDDVARDLAELLGVPAESILRVSAREGTNVEAVLEAVVKQVRHPRGDPTHPSRPSSSTATTTPTKAWWPMSTSSTASSAVVKPCA